MALQEIVQGMKVDFIIKVEKSTCNVPEDISDIDLSKSNLFWKKPSGAVLNTGVVLKTTGTDGLLFYSMISPPTGIDTLELDEPGIWELSYLVTLNSEYVLKPLKVVEFEVLVDEFL